MPKEYETLNQLDAEVLFVLMMHRGENNAIQRWSLIKRIYGDDVETDEIDNNNLYDRAVRNSIQRLRESGQHICNRGNGAGYYIADSRDEYERFKEYYLGPAYPKFIAAKKMDEAADARWGKQAKQAPQGQQTLFA